MGKFGGDLTDFGQTGSLYLKNLEAIYKRPKNQLELVDKDVNVEELSFNELLALVPDNFHDDNSDYWEKEAEVGFNCKDGQTNAYVKRGTDEETEEFFDRQVTTTLVWHITTDDNHVKFLAGGKVKAKGIDWFILKVVQQDSTGTYANRFNAMDTSPDNDRLRQIGLKTLICIGGVS
ncbi:MAG: hypothetical protein RBQ97_07515 [Acholeplasma sp.]|nr:hypothetical protein [Acholeplasma sp.]